MKKNEIIWRDIITQFLVKKTVNYTQLELAKKYSFSVSTVFNALKPLRGLGGVDVGGRGFRIVDYEKILTFWATHHRPDREIMYRTYVSGGVTAIEKQMVPGVIFGAYSAWKFRYGSSPADYDKVYVYSLTDQEIKKRFPPDTTQPANLTVWRADPHVADYGQKLPLAQLFVDFWNLSEWYAKDFLNAVKEKINLR